MRTETDSLQPQTGARSAAERHLSKAIAVFDQLGAARDRADTEAAARLLTAPGSGEWVIAPENADEAIVRHGILTEGTPFLQKPFTPQALARKVREILDA